MVTGRPQSTIYGPVPTEDLQMANKRYVDGVAGSHKIFGAMTHGTVGDQFFGMSGVVNSATITNMEVIIDVGIKITRIRANVVTNAHATDWDLVVVADGSNTLALIDMENSAGVRDSGVLDVDIVAGSRICLKEETTDTGTVFYTYIIDYQFI